MRARRATDTLARNRRRESGRTSSAPRAKSSSADSERVQREAAVAAALVRARARRDSLERRSQMSAGFPQRVVLGIVAACNAPEPAPRKP